MVDQFLRADGEEPRRVEDLLLGIEGDQLPPHLGQRVDDFDLQLTQTGVESAKKAGRSGPDDGDVVYVCRRVWHGSYFARGCSAGLYLRRRGALVALGHRGGGEASLAAFGTVCLAPTNHPASSANAIAREAIAPTPGPRLREGVRGAGDLDRVVVASACPETIVGTRRG